MKRLKKLTLAGVTVLGGFILFAGTVGVIVANLTPQGVDQPRNFETTQREEVTANGLFLAINNVRVDNGLSPYARNSLLDKSAGLKCDDMVVNHYYEHDSPSGKKGYTYIEDSGQRFQWASENLNRGDFINSADVVSGWMNSESHAASILDPKFTEIGFAVCNVDGQVTVVQHKIEPKAPEIQGQSVQRSSPFRYQYNWPSTTYCTHNESEYFDDTTTCRTY